MVFCKLRFYFFFFFSSRRRHTRLQGDWSSDVCSSDLSSLPQTIRPSSMPSAAFLQRFHLLHEEIHSLINGCVLMRRWKYTKKRLEKRKSSIFYPNITRHCFLVVAWFSLFLSLL